MATSKEREPCPVDETSAGYIAGSEAFIAGRSVDDCPFQRGEANPDRLDWLNGWYGERTDEWLRKFDEKRAVNRRGKLFSGRKG